MPSKKTSRESLRLSDIRATKETQAREETDGKVITAYTESYAAGAKIPPLVVFHDGKSYWLADGFYRRAALKSLERKEAPCEVHKGTKEDAQWYACAANATHGQPRSNKDKQRAAEMALLHPNGAAMSDHQIAEHVGVANHTVAKVRKALVAGGKLSHLDSKRTGKDGKEYPAQPTVKPPAEEPEEADDDPADDPEPADAFTCPHCGAHVADDEGDCTECREPAADEKDRSRHDGPAKGIQIANEAINCLKRVLPGDKFYRRAYEIVHDYCEANMPASTKPNA